MRVDRERGVEIPDAGGSPAERELDHPEVVAEERAPRSEGQGPALVPDRIGVVAGGMERPRERVGDVDAVPSPPLHARCPEGRAGASVIRVEQGELQVHVHAVRAEQGSFGAGEPVLLARRRSITGRPEQIAQRDHVLGQRVEEIGRASCRERV